MTWLLPHPLVSAGLLALWLLLNTTMSLRPHRPWLCGRTRGGWALQALGPPKARIGRPGAILRLVARVFGDIVRSNVAVARIVLGLGGRERTSGFVNIPLDLRDPYGLAALACIITSTPGTLWVKHDPTTGMLTIHVLDLIDEERVVPHDQGAIRAALAGDLRVSTLVLAWSVTAAQLLLGLAMMCATFRILRGPRAQDRVVGFDTLYVTAMLLLVTFGIRSGSRHLLRGGAAHRVARLRRDRGARQVPSSRRGDRVSGAAEIPAWAEIVTAALLLVGRRNHPDRLPRPCAAQDFLCTGSRTHPWHDARDRLYRHGVDGLFLGVADTARSARDPACPLCPGHHADHPDPPGARGPVPGRSWRAMRGRPLPTLTASRPVGGNAFSARHRFGGTARMSMSSERRVSSLTLPRTAFAKPVRPWVPTIRRSGRTRPTADLITSKGLPSSTRSEVAYPSTPFAPRNSISSFVARTCSSATCPSMVSLSSPATNICPFAKGSNACTTIGCAWPAMLRALAV